MNQDRLQQCRVAAPTVGQTRNEGTVVETASGFQFSLRGLLAFTTGCAVFCALLKVIDPTTCAVTIGLSLPGFLSLGFCMVSVGSQRRGLRSKISIAVASTFLSLALSVALIGLAVSRSVPR